jgi:hypothetical protein
VACQCESSVPQRNDSADLLEATDVRIVPHARGAYKYGLRPDVAASLTRGSAAESPKPGLAPFSSGVAKSAAAAVGISFALKLICSRGGV